MCPAQIIPEVSPAAWAVANEMLIVCSFALGLISHWSEQAAMQLAADSLWKALLASPAIISNSCAITPITSGSLYLKDICKHSLLLIVTGAVLITAAGMASAHPPSLNSISADLHKGGNGGSGVEHRQEPPCWSWVRVIFQSQCIWSISAAGVVGNC